MSDNPTTEVTPEQSAPEQETDIRKDSPWLLRRIRQKKGGDENE